jgi:hypothetical protein
VADDGDITDTWESMNGIGFQQVGHSKFASPGHWNDPDMLVIGKVGWGPRLRDSRLTPNEQYIHITLWTLLASPLLLGNDLTQMDDFELNLVTNDEVWPCTRTHSAKRRTVWRRRTSWRSGLVRSRTDRSPSVYSIATRWI